MKKLSQLLPSVLEQLPTDPETRLVFLQRLWPRIVGPELAAKCHPETIQGSTLIVFAASDQWQLSLEELKDLLVASIHRFWADSGIDRISVRGHLD